MKTKNYLICYDISDQKRLSKARKIAYAYAVGGQKSAVEAPLGEVGIKLLFEQIKKELKEREDRLNIVEVYDDPLLLGKAFRLSFDESGSIVL